MPRHKVINRRNIPDPRLRNRVLNLSDEAMEAANSVAAELNVSAATVMDSVLRYSTALGKELILDLLVKDGHLTNDEAAHIEKNILPKPQPQPEKSEASHSKAEKPPKRQAGSGKQTQTNQE
jgi:hypothetical protein